MQQIFDWGKSLDCIYAFSFYLFLPVYLHFFKMQFKHCQAIVICVKQNAVSFSNFDGPAQWFPLACSRHRLLLVTSAFLMRTRDNISCINSASFTDAILTEGTSLRKHLEKGVQWEKKINKHCSHTFLQLYRWWKID